MAAKSKTTSNRDTLAKLRAHLAQIEQRLEMADQANERATTALRSAFESLGSQSGTNEQALRAHTDRLATHLNNLIVKTRKDVSADLKKTLANPRLDNLDTAIAATHKTLTQAEIDQADAIGKINTQIIQLSATLEQRFSQQAQATETLNTRIDDLENNTAERLLSIEEQTAGAVIDIGERIVTLSDEMGARREQVKEQLHERMLEGNIETQQEIDALKAEMARRFDATHDELDGQLTPLSRQIATLSARMTSLENGQPNSVSSAAQNAVPPFPSAPQTGQAADSLAGSLNGGPSGEFTAFEPPIDAFSPPPAPLVSTPISAPPPSFTPLDPHAASASLASTQLASAQGETDSPADMDGPAEFNPAGYESNIAPLYPQNITPPPPLPQSTPYGDAGAYDSAPYDPDTYNSVPYDSGNPYASAASEDNPYSNLSPAPFPASNDGNYDQTMETARPGGDLNANNGNIKRSLFSNRTLRTGVSAAAILAIATFGTLSVINMVGDKDGQTIVQNDAINPQNPNAASDSPWQQNGGATNAPNYDVTLQEPTGQIASPDGTVGKLSTAVNADHDTLEAAVAAGNPVAQLQKGLGLIQAGQSEQAASFIRLSANQGQPAAQYYLGHMYENGDGVPADSLQARKLTEMAAQAGHRIAMYDVALYYIEGKGGVDINMSTAAGWFRKAADYGMVDAQYNLAVLHERGTGVARDLAESYVWFTIAGTNGDQDSAQRAQQIKAMLSGDEVGRAEARIAGFKPAQIDESVNGIFTNLAWNKSAPKRDERVVKVQQYLTGLGYEAGIADGAIGPKTRDAIKSFESANGLPETGQIDDALLARLTAANGA